MWVAILALLVAAAVGVNSIIYANSVARRSGRSWCDVVRTLDAAYQQTPPTTPLGRQLAADMHNLRVRLGC